ncbi:MAG TPA: DUF4242 domain-containing protein [Chitinophagaceae bacterium]|jgi:uncharacterized protein DUF4242|nr:DUF4242 domain-containing protein [Chitinophagaceae bacterium]
MKTIINRFTLFVVIIFFAGFPSFAQKTAGTHNSKTTNSKVMKTYLIERDIPDAGKLTPEQLKSISQTSCKVLKEMGPEIEWLQSYVTGDKIYCVYKAENEELIREHAKKGGFPANYIMEISSVISPATATAR